MSTDTLRRAATRLRELADAAAPGPWSAFGTGRAGGDHWHVFDPDGESIASIAAQDGSNEEQREPTAALIATMGPTMAAALAHYFDLEADSIELATAIADPEVVAATLAQPGPQACLQLARLVLGEA
ncbi:MAG: hypothetical protein J0H73_11770 [Salana multivorans]|uniref:hypothetical protein n=1 Tax=Salana multivorans TaxID=120377 RepID=UPI000963611D|nr:hypothetical protein [Salana multivorans]MBN8882977.1 hypothetical protein [Salana multivorans]OJX94069.1 MAG: hypothetical protein BGO96_09690 [Micrococcales bacterium 73-15]